MNGHVWNYDSYVAEFWRKISRPTKKKKEEKIRQNEKTKKEEGAAPWWFHAGFIPSSAVYVGLASDWQCAPQD